MTFNCIVQLKSDHPLQKLKLVMQVKNLWSYFNNPVQYITVSLSIHDVLQSVVNA